MFFNKSRYICRLTLLYFFKKKLFLDKKLKILRRSTIVSANNDYNMLIYNGQNLKKLLVLEFNINKKAGQFTFTRKPYFFPLRKKKK